MLIFLLFLIVSADDSCEKRTKIYDLNGNSNANYFYFDERTYLETAENITPQNYKNNIINTIPCTGIWCIDKQWKCQFGNSRDCYNVEHIVPKAHNILEIYGCPVDIQGNLIMAYGAWNQQLSNSYYGEKVEIYGSGIFKSAYKSIYKACYNSTSDPTVYPEELCLSNNQNLQIGVILLVISLILLSIAIFLSVKFKNDLIKELYSDIKSLLK